MFIESLEINYNNEYLITDIDDCLIKSKKEIIKQGFVPKEFYFDEHIYNTNKEIVFNSAELTEWGYEFIELIKNKSIENYLLLTSASNRTNILTKIFGISKEHIYEGYSKQDKILLLESINNESIYVDNSSFVKKNIFNDYVNCIVYPKINKPNKIKYTI